MSQAPRLTRAQKARLANVSYILNRMNPATTDNPAQAEVIKHVAANMSLDYERDMMAYLHSPAGKRYCEEFAKGAKERGTLLTSPDFQNLVIRRVLPMLLRAR